MKSLKISLAVAVLFMGIGSQSLAGEQIFQILKWNLSEYEEGYVGLHLHLKAANADRYACNFKVRLLGKNKTILGETDATVYALTKAKTSQIFAKFYGVKYDDVQSFDLEHVTSMKDGEF